MLNPSRFVNSGAIHLKPAGSQPTPPTTITVDTTLNPLASGAVGGVANGVGSTYTITPNYGVTAGSNEFFSFSTFNLGINDTAEFTAANTITNIVSRVTGGASTTIDGTIVSPVGFWFVNPAGMIITGNGKFQVNGNVALGAADYISFDSTHRFYANPSLASTLFTEAPQAFGFLPDSQAGAFTASAWTPDAFSGSLTIAGGSGLALDQTTLTAPGGITLSANSGAVALSASNLSTDTASEVQAGNIQITGPVVTIVGGTISASNSGSVAEAFTSGNAGNIGVTASGADPSGGFALSVSGGAVMVSNGSSEVGNGGNVSLRAPAGTVELGLPTGMASTLGFVGQVFVGSGGGQGGGAGQIVIAGSSVNLNDASVSSGTQSTVNGPQPAISITSSAGPTAVTGSLLLTETNYSANSGAIAVTGPSILATNSSFTTESVDAGPAGSITLSATGADPHGGFALQVSGGSSIDSGAVNGSDIGTDIQGNITLSAPKGTVQIGLSTDTTSTTIATAANLVIAGSVGDIAVTGLQVNLNQATLTANSASDSNPTASTAIGITATGGPVHILNGSKLSSTTSFSANAADIAVSGPSILVDASTITVATSGAGNAGNISLTANGSDPSGGYALKISGGAQITANSTAASTPGGNAGTISVTANDGTVDVASTTTKTQLSTTAGAQSGEAGVISIAANQIMLNDALIDTSVSTTGPVSGLTPASVVLSATHAVSIMDSLIDLQTFGSVDAGSASITGDTVAISGGLQPTPVPNSPFTFPQNTAILTGTSGTGNAGSVNISSAGLLAVSNATVSSQSLGSTGYGGQIALVGSGILISQQSLVSADYRNPGGNPGAAGTITINSTGAAAPSDPLQTELTSATPGVVRIVDSGVTASNDGGTGSHGSIGTFGQVAIVSGAPGASNSGNVVIVGSVISTDVLDGGLGNNLTIAAKNGVYIGSSTTGGFADPIARSSFPDPRSSVESSLISAQTDSTAVSGGQIAISGGASGITVVNSNIDAGTTRTVSGIVLNDPSTGAITLTDASLQSGTSGMNRSGDITVSGPEVSVDGGTITAKTTGPGDAGNIAMTASAADLKGVAALLVRGGATITSDAIDGQSGANAGTVALTAANGTVQVGASTDAANAPTTISTAAGPAAGQVGYITLQGASVTVIGAGLSASTASAVDPPADHAAISIASTAGPVTLTGADLSAATTGAATASYIDITGPSVAMVGGSMTAKTTSSGSAGDITITASAGGAVGEPALQVSGGAQITSDASQGQGGQADAGSVTLTALKGAIQLGLAGDAAPTLLSTAAGSAAGAAGTIKIASAGTLALANTSVDTSVASTASSVLAPGTIALTAPGSITLTGSNLGAKTSGSVAAGDIEVNAGGPLQISSPTGGARSEVSSSSTWTTASAGAAGKITLAGTAITLDASDVTATVVGGSSASKAADIVLRAGGAVSLSDGATIKADTAGAAPGGAIQVLTPGAVTVAGAGTALTSNTSGVGAGGDIDLGTAAQSGNGIGAAPIASLGVSGGASISANAGGSGSGGKVTLTAAGLSLTDGASIATTAKGTGNSGDIAITLQPASPANGAAPAPVLLTGNSLITTNAAESTGGNITLNAGGSPLQLQGSAIEATAGADGNGGDVTLNDVGQSLLAASGILAQANHGNGGVIDIYLQKGALFLEDSESLVSASSNTGNNGTVTINSPQTDLNSALAAPDVNVARAPELSANVCRHDAGRSTFVREGRGGVEPGPDNYLSANSTAAPSTAAASAARGVEADAGTQAVSVGQSARMAARLATPAADLGCR